MNQNLRDRLLASTVIAGSLFVATAALAQSAPPAAAAAESAGEDQTIVVTGSRIARPELIASSPVTVVSDKAIQLSGRSRTEDIVNSLPQVYASQSSGVSNGADGTATLNLRNLGETRTLVLVDGRRLPPGDPSREAGSILGSAADINNIPSILIKRVDVLTGGASAIYGADAVAGVVNFVLDRDFEGFKIDGQTGLYAHNNDNPVASVIAADPRKFSYPHGNETDGLNYDISGAFGTKFGDGRGHFSVFASYHQQRAVTQDARDYSACGFGSNASTTSFLDNLSCFGSRNSAVANFITDSGNGDAFIVDSTTGKTFRPFENTDRYNFAPTNYYQRPDRRYNIGAFVHYDVSDAFKPYADFLYMKDKSDAQIAPSGTFGNLFTLNCSNPMFSAVQAGALGCALPVSGNFADSRQTVDTVIFKRNVEGGSRDDQLEHRAFRILGGAKGELSSAWSYDAYAQLGKTIYRETYLNDFSFSRVRNALNACLNPDGTPIADTSCAPYNIFTGTTTIQPTSATGVTQAALDYVQTPGNKSGYTKEFVADFALNGQLGEYGIKSPWAEDGVNVAIGGEYRKEWVRLNTDLAYSTGDLLGQGGETKPSAGSYDVKEAFVEADIPLLKNIPGFQRFDINAAYRYSYYSTVKTTNTWKVGFEWQPFAGEMESAIRFRGTINRAVRAPTIFDLFAPRQLGLGGSGDPCSADEYNGDEVGCLRTGRNDPNFLTHLHNGIVSNPASQYNSQTAGAVTAGSTLKPETAITKTVGVVFAPRGLLRGFTATVDYYTINLRDTIKTDGYDTIISQCMATGSDYYCDLIKRDPVNGSLWLGPGGYIIDPIYNSGHLKNSGIDVSVAYRLDLDRLGLKAGVIDMSLNGTYVLKQKTEVLNHLPNGSLSSAGYYECVGFYGDNCGVPTPKWRHTFRATWAPVDNFALTATWRHFGGSRWEAAATDINPGSDGTGKAGHPFDRIKSVNYLDLVASVNIDDKFTFRVGANNIFDKDPPVINGNDQLNAYVNGNTYPGVYDALGRYLFVGVTARY
ncbi:TonB-dependent receptor plug domain-containing protein [Flavisphingomonas formosensis]|uniref:TonB-dependent receptor plug domain-containing protein n=1 Tax=Flavisphingomonas formosensis TaxID=861534 RepID=UPI0012F95AB2|nr:TonB-dependent receptor plug domain-containing protein [Sphingomonas formosensis]